MLQVEKPHALPGHPERHKPPKKLIRELHPQTTCFQPSLSRWPMHIFTQTACVMLCKQQYPSICSIHAPKALDRRSVTEL